MTNVLYRGFNFILVQSSATLPAIVVRPVLVCVLATAAAYVVGDYRLNGRRLGFALMNPNPLVHVILICVGRSFVSAHLDKIVSCYA